MRFLVDECTGPNVASWLRENDYEVLSRLFQNYLLELPDSFVVATEKQVRFARAMPPPSR